MTDLPGGKKERLVRRFFLEHHGGEVPIDSTVQQLYTQFMVNNEDSMVSYGLFNGVVKKLRNGFSPVRAENARQDSLVRTAGHPMLPLQLDEPVMEPAEIIEIGNMAFPEFRNYKTGDLVDLIFSDHTKEGGIYSGTANIVIGESGVGKSTVMLDILAKIRRHETDAKILYVSSEMTRNDLFFYFAKTPIIANVPTLLLMDYITGRFDLILRDAINADHDIILLDSYQDIIVKMADVLGWKTTRAATWLTNMLIEAADKRGKTIFAIQHLTKGGQYVGSTYLKHATTAMMEMRFDEAGRRYVEFSKNRRGGSMINRRMYFTLKDGEILWDEIAWKQENEAVGLSELENSQRENLDQKFTELFLSVTPPQATEDSVEDTETVAESTDVD